MADCKALAAKVKAGQMKNPPKNCVAIEPILTPMVDWPENCAATVSYTTPWIAVDRRNGCNHTAFFIIVINLVNGEELGRSVIHTAMKMIASTTGPSWSIPVDVRVASSTAPIGRPTTTTGVFFVCPTNCVASNLSYGAVTTSYWKGSLTLSAKEMIAGSWRDHVGGYWRITFNNPEWVATTSSDLTTGDSRCDNAYTATKPGCVLPTVPATMTFSRSTNPEFANHVERALLSGLPGQAGSTTYLHRLYDAALSRKNGDTACPASLPRPSGKQCDEYPFRSTNEGAYTGGDSTPRSWDGCEMPDPPRTGPTGFSRCFINEKQNGSAGGLLGGFYLQQRMLTSDPFQVAFS